MTKDDLKVYIDLKRARDSKQHRLVTLDAQIKSLAYRGFERFNSRKSSELKSILLKRKTETERHLKELNDRLTVEFLKLDEAFSTLDYDEAMVMNLRYLRGLSWEGKNSVLDELQNSNAACERTHMFKLHIAALQKLEKIAN